MKMRFGMGSPQPVAPLRIPERAGGGHEAEPPELYLLICPGCEYVWQVRSRDHPTVRAGVHRCPRCERRV